MWDKYDPGDSSDDSASSGGPSRKKRRTREQALYGDSDDEAQPTARRAPTQLFVPSSGLHESPLERPVAPTEAEAEMQREQTAAFEPASFVSSRGGIGHQCAPEPPAQPGLGARGGIGKRSGLTSMAMFVSASTAKPAHTEDVVPPIRAAPAQPRTTVTPGIKLSTGGKFDASAYMAKMGWTGGGLGKDGHGIINPIEVQLRPERAGIAYGGLREKTAQAKQEARRRGEAVSSDDDERTRRPRSTRKQPAAWTQPEKKPRKPKVEHRTYEQIIAEIGGAPASVGKIIDATGREVSDLAAALAHKGVPSVQTSHLPELLHNLRLICDDNTHALTALAREGAQILEKRKWLQREADEAARRRAVELGEIARIRAVLVLVEQVEALGAALDLRGDAAQLDQLDEVVARIGSEFGAQIVEFRLDEAVVGAIAPLLQAQWQTWTPLTAPRHTLLYLERWQDALITQRALPKQRRGAMTAYESLLWHAWMPRVRSAVNNEWAPSSTAAVALLEAWKPVLPRFVLDNIIDQLVLPKLRTAVAEYDAKTARSPLEHLVFPWLPVLGEGRLGEVLQEARRKLRSVLKQCDVGAAPARGLAQWRKLYQQTAGGADWDALVLATVVPKLAALLRVELVFDADPARWDTPVPLLSTLLEWRSVVRRSVFVRVLAGEFFPPWLRLLHTWLTARTLRGVAQWYTHWRTWFAQLGTDPAIDSGFLAALNLINTALDHPSTPPPSPHFQLPSRRNPPAAPAQHDDGVALTFRAVLEAELALHDLFLLKTPHVKQLGPVSTANILRVSPLSAPSAAGALVYIDDDVIFLKPPAPAPDDEWQPISLAALIIHLTH